LVGQPADRTNVTMADRPIGYLTGWLFSQAARHSAPIQAPSSTDDSAIIERPFPPLFHPCVQVAVIWRNLASIIDIQSIKSISIFVPSNRRRDSLPPAGR